MKYECPVLTRCCFCMPLRKSLLIFGYLNFMFSMFLVVGYSIAVSQDHKRPVINYHGVFVHSVPAELCLLLSLCEVVITALLLYGLHQKSVKYIKWFYYYTAAMTAGIGLLQLLKVKQDRFWYEDEMLLPTALLSLAIQAYLLILVKSLMHKLANTASVHGYENMLHSAVVGEDRKETIIAQPV